MTIGFAIEFLLKREQLNKLLLFEQHQ